MSVAGRTDTLADTPKFSRERTVRPVITLTASSNTQSPSKILYFSDVSQVAAGLYVSGNNINITSPVPGFFNANVTVSSVNTIAQSVTISANVTANVYVGDKFEFDNTITYRAFQGYFPNTVLVTDSRLANATFGDPANNAPIAHVGWVKVNEGKGYIQDIQITNAGNGYSNGYVVFSGISYTTAPNASYYVSNTITGVITNVVINNAGAGINTTPTATVSGGNNAVLTVVPGGRMNRVSVETLYCLSNGVALDANSGGKYFPNL